MPETSRMSVVLWMLNQAPEPTAAAPAQLHKLSGQSQCSSLPQVHPAPQFSLCTQEQEEDSTSCPFCSWRWGVTLEISVVKRAELLPHMGSIEFLLCLFLAVCL